MKNRFVFLLFAAAVLTVAVLPAGTQAFVLTATDFSGVMAYESHGNVVEAFGLDSRFAGMGYNTAAAINFSFNYDPSSPSINDIMSNPNKPYRWTVGLSNLEDPWFGQALPDITLSGTASYSQLMGGASHAWSVFDSHFPTEGSYFLDYSFTGPNSGFGTLALAANVDYGHLGNCLPDQWMNQFCSDAELTLAADPVPEPMTFLLFGAGLAGVGMIRRRKLAAK